jgi:16S rRNA (guanine527-N7)-methyltransferase
MRHARSPEVGESTRQAAQLEQGLAALGIELPVAVQACLLAFVALLCKWNKTYNLTAVNDQEKVLSHHLLDSLAVLPFVPEGSLLDVGSGGGMPGIPLAIARPDLHVTLLDSNSKKTAFLQQAMIELMLPNISVHCGRVEQYHPSIGVATIVSRAFSELADFVRLTRHLLVAGGQWLAMKGVWPHDEIERLPADVRLDAAHRLQVPGVEGERHLVVIRRVDAYRSGGS